MSRSARTENTTPEKRLFVALATVYRSLVAQHEPTAHALMPLCARTSSQIQRRRMCSLLGMAHRITETPVDGNISILARVPRLSSTAQSYIGAYRHISRTMRRPFQKLVIQRTSRGRYVNSSALPRYFKVGCRRAGPDFVYRRPAEICRCLHVNIRR